ncbi:MAG: Flp pilus assembly protein TadB [Candidatus Carbobacillus altaicus]|uniref:Flp pilus assembly protein TadB n=1 Tax=Candidatus Carbonibacillus altaicus TaxID=2163959 RepID=A0A2R6Y0S2_9BACL|nr:MAG: Flp pilus assembly protein TadB [Candidatus Carbobacillus altaicus]
MSELSAALIILSLGSLLYAFNIDVYNIFKEKIDPFNQARRIWQTQKNIQYVAGSILFFFVVRLFGGWFFSLILSVLFFLFLKFAWSKINLVFKRSKLRKAMLKDMDSLINSLVNALQSGYGFLAALKATQTYIPEPLKSEIGKIVDRVESGKMDLEESLFLFHEQYKLPETRRFVYTLSFAAKYSGRDLIPVLKAMAGTFRMIYQTQEKLNARTTQIKLSLYILPISPIIMLGMLQLAMPEAVQILFHEGRMILFIGLSLIAAALIWSLNMIAKFSEKE